MPVAYLVVTGVFFLIHLLVVIRRLAADQSDRQTEDNTRSLC